MTVDVVLMFKWWLHRTEMGFSMRSSFMLWYVTHIHHDLRFMLWLDDRTSWMIRHKRRIQ